MAPTRDVLYEPASMHSTLRRTLALLSLAVLGGCSRDEARKEAPAALAAPAPRVAEQHSRCLAVWR